MISEDIFQENLEKIDLHEVLQKERHQRNRKLLESVVY